MKLPSDDKKDTAPLDEEGLWDANDVARFLKASRSWVYQRAQAGQLPCVKIGGLLRFEPAAIRAFIKEQGRR
ncbi:helix-turn-helix domain-containing protein [Myxococcus sp. AB025B]|uniref:helix-turn-helix domain-containing protein n=1 Tax=Myxococcus sp. AB025B TaxID=2562794 RepID=UPI001141D707|nr:helix-turn-helix domain-containing protein [Myxococcus sp. AB025B]